MHSQPLIVGYVAPFFSISKSFVCLDLNGALIGPHYIKKPCISFSLILHCQLLSFNLHIDKRLLKPWKSRKIAILKLIQKSVMLANPTA